MGITINPKKRYDEAMEKQEARHEQVPADEQYHCIEVLSWKQVEKELNYWAANGWKMVALRDGMRGQMDMGYRIVLERL